MEIWHHVGFGHKDNVDALVDGLGLKYKRTPLFGGGWLITFDIAESDPCWPRLEVVVREKHAVDLFDTFFTPEEVLAAECVRLIPVHERGYPQPDHDGSWRELSYEDGCRKCGVGFRQKAPLQIAKEPRLGKYDFVSLYWTYALFCTSRVLEALQAEGIRGYEVWPALIRRTAEASQVISQLFVPSVANPGLGEEDKVQPETCANCGITKYESHMRGYMRLKREALLPDLDLQQSYEWFGSGSHAGYREILITNRLARLIIEKGWQGVRLKPVVLV